MATLPRSAVRPAWTTEPSVLVAARPHPRLARSPIRRSTYAAFVCLGLATCITTNTTYIELSYLMVHAPERLLIFPYAILALQSANVYPILYVWLNPQHRNVSLTHIAWCCLVSALIVSSCISCFWDRSIRVLDGQHSVSFLVLTHLGGMTSAIFSTVVTPYAAAFPSIYTSALSNGTNLSGVLVALLGLWQAPYTAEPIFTVSACYLACALVATSAMCAFGFLEWFPSVSADRQRIVVSSRDNNNHEHHKIHHYDTTYVDTEAHTAGMRSTCTLRQRVFGWFWRELACQALLAALFYGILPSISPFLFARYSSLEPARAAEHQLLATAFIFFVNPVARCLTSISQLSAVYTASLFVVAVGVFLIICTMLNEPPASSDHALGFLLPLILYVTSSAVHTYTQTMLALAIKQQADCTRDAVFVDSASQWSGFCIQMGALIGSLVVFPVAVAWPQRFQSTTSL